MSGEVCKSHSCTEQDCSNCQMSSGSVGGVDVVSSGPELRKLLEEVFTDTYMHQNTNFENFKAFCYSSAVIVNWQADTLIYRRDLLDAFVAESTKFSSWNEMVKDAVDKKFVHENTSQNR